MRTCVRSGNKAKKKMKSYARLPLITQKKRKKIPFSHSHQKKSAIIVSNTALLKKKVQTQFWIMDISNVPMSHLFQHFSRQ